MLTALSDPRISLAESIPVTFAAEDSVEENTRALDRDDTEPFS